MEFAGPWTGNASAGGAAVTGAGAGASKLGVGRDGCRHRLEPAHARAQVEAMRLAIGNEALRARRRRAGAGSRQQQAALVMPAVDRAERQAERLRGARPSVALRKIQRQIDEHGRITESYLATSGHRLCIRKSATSRRLARCGRPRFQKTVHMWTTRRRRRALPEMDKFPGMPVCPTSTPSGRRSALRANARDSLR